MDGLWSLLPAAVFAALLVCELTQPRRALSMAPTARWIGNAGLYAANTAAVAATAATPFDGMIASLGLVPGPPAGAWAWQLAAIPLLDLLLYVLHRLQHAVSLLWWFHAVHHSDADVDVSTAVRHHPGDYLLNFAIVSAVAAAAGIAAATLAAYGLLLLSVQMLQHANVALPDRLDRALRPVFATPGLHRVHHSRVAAEGNANFGAVLSIWDRLFGTYLAPRDSGPAAYGVDALADPRHQRLHWMLMTPLVLGRPMRTAASHQQR